MAEEEEGGERGSKKRGSRGEVEGEGEQERRVKRGRRKKGEEEREGDS